MAGEPLFERGELADAADLARWCSISRRWSTFRRIKPRRFSAPPSAPVSLAGLSITWRPRSGARWPHLTRDAGSGNPTRPASWGTSRASRWGRNGKQVVECDDPIGSRFRRTTKAHELPPIIRRQRARACAWSRRNSSRRTRRVGGGGRSSDAGAAGGCRCGCLAGGERMTASARRREPAM